jgi:N-acetylmuramoyl-L-alanine amidase
MSCRFWVLVFLLASAPLGASAAGMVDVDVTDQQETISILVPNTEPHKVFTIENPDRLVVDVPAIAGHPRAVLPDSYHGNLIGKLRYGLFNPETSRFVFDLNQRVRVGDVREENSRKGDLLFITIAGAGEGKKVAGEAKTGSKKLSHHVAAKPAGKPVVVIDAGHGGVDPGTIGPEGTQEKDIVLKVALALRDRLMKTGHYDVKLTRDDDTFIMLRKRVDIARKAHGSLFISLHADSAPDEDAHGLSVYTVSEQASDAEAEALATRENKSDVLAGMDLSDEREDVAGILISLAERDTNNHSAMLADLLVTSIDDRVALLPNSHRFAGFAVLKAPDIPSVLIETGFLSNDREEKLLNSKPYRDKLVNSIAKGIDSYFRHEKQGDNL